ncbi:hypothetical protein [Streptomyces erythrochromogenes]|uniref:hypothetical protein n=2 Tax=Streptomyces erythrochromogenes TaxID=285574 RepID=UPI0027E23A0F|nr:hypothetical protein [Streptomyces erythrochromogenes]
MAHVRFNGARHGGGRGVPGGVRGLLRRGTGHACRRTRGLLRGRLGFRDRGAVRVLAAGLVDSGPGGARGERRTGRLRPPRLPGSPPEKVRDAFAGLQATLDGSCTPSECAYFLGRVYDELHGLDAAMKADPKGPGHFPEPIALIAKLDAELGGDRSFKNLKAHQTLLIGTRDKINTWMQGHPDDYR